MTYNVFGGTLNLAQLQLQLEMTRLIKLPCICFFTYLLIYLLTEIV